MQIGVDLGGTNIAVGLVNDEGELISSLSRPTLPKRGWRSIIDEIISLIDTVLEAMPLEDNLKAIGVGIPGVADPTTGNVLVCVNLNWRDVPLGKILRDTFQVPVSIDNDATVAAAAEFKVALKSKYKNAIMLTLGTGVGGGIMLQGKMYSGHHGIASEIGHMFISNNFYDCNCGRNGCLETFASSTALIKYVNHQAKLHASSELARNVEAGVDVNGKMIFEAAKAGDVLATEAVDRLVYYLARGMMNLVAVLDPEMIVIGGGLADAGDFLLERIKREFYTLKYYPSLPIAMVTLASLKNDAGIIGAAMNAEQYS
jgi:glucokinase